MSISINEFLTKFEGVKKSGSQWMARCPAHDDRKASLSIRQGDKGIVLFCQAGCETKYVIEAIGLKISDIFDQSLDSTAKNNGHKQIIATYDYRDESGKLIYQVARLEPKDFRQRRPDGAGGWIWNLEGVDRVLYRLPELMADDSDGWVFIAEGERDVDETLRAWGLTATCNVGGAGKWRKEYSKYFKGRRVCILPDNDPPPAKDGKQKEGYAGQKHAVKIYDFLRAATACVVVLALPGLPIKGDVSDWKRAGGTRDELLKMADDLAALLPEKIAQRVSEYSRLIADPDFSGDPSEALRNDAPSDPSYIFIDYKMIRDLPTLTGLAWRALLQANEPPQYFKRGELLVRTERDDDGVVTRELTPDRLRHELARIAIWLEKGTDGKPPKDVVADVLATPSPALPILNRIVEVPVFAPNGRLQTDPGYHPDARVYYWPARHLTCLPVPSAPSASDVKRSVELIEELICDFPFASQSDKSHAIALMLLPFCRDLIDGPTPNHLIEASLPGSGKGLLVEVLVYPSIGRNVSLITAPRDDDEWAKKITMSLLEDRGAIQIDNVNRKLDSGSLAAALTAHTWHGRILSRNVSANMPVRCAWITTANNIQVSEEHARRMIRSKLTPATDSPEQRPETDFQHPDIREWVQRERARFIQAAHILIQNWLAQGQPKPKITPLGSFEHWSRVVGGILECASVPGFLANLKDFYAASNQEKTVWRAFCKAWHDRYADREVLAADLMEIAEQVEGFDIRGDSPQSRKISLGRNLQKKNGAVYADFRIVRSGESGGYVYWRLQPV